MSSIDLHCIVVFLLKLCDIDQMYREKNSRSVIKTISWRVWATLTTIALVVTVGGPFKVALAVGALEVFSKMLLYFLHERIWDRISFGRVENSDKLNVSVQDTDVRGLCL